MATSAIASYAGYRPDYASSKSLYGAAGTPAGASEATYGPAVSISLSINAIRVTGELLTTEQPEENVEDDATVPAKTRAGGLETALQNILAEVKENQGLTGKVAKRLFKIVSALNTARGTDTKLGELDLEAREEVRSSRKELNEFFRKQHSSVLVDESLIHFIELSARLESLREFALRTTEILEGLKSSDTPDTPDTPDALPSVDEETETVPATDIEA
ncbi:hypothetical protein [Paremcibacter congregatus]|uniref:Uncharacterized protein n=1 Tax=Paremcibacter congregatus TaxID=2043170 RepID=A0A2G4YW25_9PROT|nr:hypothetical protein [Paremcibacter congregatus]PHZ86463.1 hypothetical protein CRD36_00825 [Paremcibacter congregatus]QDE28440.1 hypothetical protein FIV45_14770 [Paremcibacter congregatus]